MDRMTSAHTFRSTRCSSNTTSRAGGGIVTYTGIVSFVKNVVRGSWTSTVVGSDKVDVWGERGSDSPWAEYLRICTFTVRVKMGCDLLVVRSVAIKIWQIDDLSAWVCKH